MSDLDKALAALLWACRVTARRRRQRARTASHRSGEDSAPGDQPPYSPTRDAGARKTKPCNRRVILTES
jgi:hypothetical protein